MVLCFGEIMLRWQPHLATHTAVLHIGGAEANVAASLAQWGMPVQYVSALPQHDLGLAIVAQLETLGIRCNQMLYGGERIGTYYLQPGADMKAASVIYDRQHSAFAELRPGTIDWAMLLKGVDWLHWSAITPALNERMPTVLTELLQTAYQLGITISVDLNHRPKLWQYGAAPIEKMRPLLAYCHIAMGNLWAVESLLGIPSPLASSEDQPATALLEAAQQSLLQLHEAYPHLQALAYTFRMPNSYWGVLQEGANRAVSTIHSLGQVVDKVGTGDSFMAGLIYGLRQPHWNTQQRVDFAAAAAVTKFAVIGDFNTTPLATIQSLAQSSLS